MGNSESSKRDLISNHKLNIFSVKNEYINYSFFFHYPEKKVNKCLMIITYEEPDKYKDLISDDYILLITGYVGNGRAYDIILNLFKISEKNIIIYPVYWLSYDVLYETDFKGLIILVDPPINIEDKTLISDPYKYSPFGYFIERDIKKLRGIYNLISTNDDHYYDHIFSLFKNKLFKPKYINKNELMKTIKEDINIYFNK